MSFELLPGLQELQALPKGAHWFCPRLSPNDTSDYSEGEDGDAAAGDADKRDHARKVDKAKQRQSLALNCMQIIAFDGSDAESLKQEYQKDLDLQLGRCDACVKSYYRALPGHLESLESDFDADAVEAFRQTVNNMNIARIVKGLNAIKKELLALPPEKRGVGSLDQAGCLAIFEPLCCAPFLHDENLLQKYFDEPFKLVQTKKRLKMTYFTPAITSFLFSSSEDRYNWAYTTAVRYKKPLTQLDFDWSIRDFLHEAAERVNISNVDKDFLPAFWNGARLLIGKLDKDLITHSLRAMDSDIYRLALEHLQIDSEGFLDLVGTLQLLLLKAPNDFWDAMGAISPVTIVEQIFNAPAVERIACETGRNGSTELDDLQDILLWVEPFLASIKAINRVSACRALVHQLILRFQTNRYSQLAKDYCYTLGLRVLDETLRSLLESQSSKNPISEATISEVLEVVEQQIPSICADIRSLRASTTRTDAAQLGLQIIQHAISLDCRVLKVDFERVNSKQPLQHHKNTKSAALWQSITQNITKKDSELAIIVLLGCRELTGLEPMVVPNGKHMSSDWRHFNETFDRICGYVADVLEKVTDFPERDLRALLQNLNKASALFATLFSANREVQEGALEVLKAASGQTGRRETLDFVLHNSFSTALSMTSNYLRVAAKRKVFAPMPRALKICDDLVDILCNSQDGILRSRELTSEESRVTRDFWQAFWQALSSIFEYTEDWSTQGHPKDVLKDFCRDAMQVGERLFDEYAIFTTAIKRSGKNESASSTESDLLQHPKLATKGLVKWLRLRDEYLSSKSVSLVCKLLVRFHDEAVDLNETELTYIESIMDGSTRSALSGQQSAELKSALEAHTGQPFDDDEEVLPAKASSTRLPVKGQRQGQLDLNLWKATAASRGSPAISSEAESDDDDLAKVREKTSAGVELAKARLEQKKLDSQRRQVALSNRAPPQPPVNVLDIRARRKAEKEAKERRDAAAREHARKVRGQADEANGAGSGILGIGVRGKEEVPKGEGMYVSDESSDEDDMDKELFGITKNAKATKAPELSAQERALRQLPQVPVKKKKIIRTAKDMRARIAPDLSSLHQSILGWEYFATGDFPPGSRTDIYSQVPNKFPSPVHYQQVFQPLLELEAWQGFVKSREENNFKAYEIKISNRSSVDAFVEVSTTMTHADNKDIQIGEGDVILMSKDKSPANAIDVPHCLARVFRITRKKAFLEILYRVVPGNPLLNGLVPNSSVYGVKVQSMTPLEREYGALKSLQYYDLCDEIVSAKPSPLLKYNDRLLEPLIKNYNVNKAQAKAVQSAVDNDAFTLIQGPPGSGKTKTIVAIVGALLSSNLLSDRSVPAPPPRGVPTTQSSAPVAKKLLVCAPSNAAVDELVMRFKEGVKTLSGVHKKINIVRLGRSDAINTQVADVTLDELVSKRLNITGDQGKDAKSKNSEIFKEHKMVSDKLNDAREQLDSGTIKGAEVGRLRDEVDVLRRRKAQLGTAVDNVRDQENKMGREAELNRRRAQQSVLDESHIICATLSGSGHEMFRNLNVEFETVVVDEAAQCVEMSALIPLKYGCSKCILVGDPKQLPPTVFSKEAAKFQYEQSLFVRMQSNHPEDVHLLDTQYRMHPDISAFPSESFYDSRLLDGPNMAGQRERPWHANSLLRPYMFFDVQGQHQAAPKGHSLINIAEIEAAMALFEKLTRDYSGYNFKGKIGIITPYKSQLRELKDRFSRKYGQAVFDTVEFNTTDAYQGRESEVIIFSCVRASPAGGIGFLQDIRRMNVGLTRAKSSLWVLGNSESLARGEYWRKLVENAKSRQLYTEGNLKQLLHTSTGGSWKPPVIPTMSAVAYPPESMRRPSSTDKMDVDSVNGKPSVTIPEPAALKKEPSSSASIPVKRKASTSSSDSDVDMENSMDGAASDKVAPTEPENGPQKSFNVWDYNPSNGTAHTPGARPLVSGPGQTEGEPRPPKKKKPVDPFIKPNRPKKPRPT